MADITHELPLRPKRGPYGPPPHYGPSPKPYTPYKPAVTFNLFIENIYWGFKDMANTSKLLWDNW